MYARASSLSFFFPPHRPHFMWIFPEMRAVLWAAFAPCILKWTKGWHLQSANAPGKTLSFSALISNKPFHRVPYTLLSVEAIPNWACHLVSRDSCIMLCLMALLRWQGDKSFCLPDNFSFQIKIWARFVLSATGTSSKWPASHFSQHTQKKANCKNRLQVLRYDWEAPFLCISRNREYIP